MVITRGRGRGWHGNNPGHAKASKGQKVKFEFPVKIVNQGQLRPLTLDEVSKAGVKPLAKANIPIGNKERGCCD